MRRIQAMSAAILLSILTTGCIETHMLVTVDNDGSGTVNERVVMNKMIIGMFSGMMQSMGDEEGDVPEQGEETEFFSREKVLTQMEKMGSGVELESYEEIEDEKGIGYLAVFRFDDINTLRLKQDPGESMPSMPGEEETVVEEDEDEYILFSFEAGSPARLVITPPKEDENEEEPEVDMTGEEDAEDTSSDEGGMQMGGFEQMAEFMRGMHVSFALEVEGRIIETNAQFVEGPRITVMDIDFDKLIDDPEKLRALEAAENKGPAAAQELLKDIPGIKVDLANELVVTFE
ncbi:MAG: hypothetical protein JXA28_07970 [Bacteroidetes bacterium]|nr:hypothetical protein [Bacteroidota bacterium]